VLGVNDHSEAYMMSCNVKQDRKCTCNVTLRRFRATIAAVDNL